LADPSIRGTLLRHAIYDKDGIDADKPAFVKELKEVGRGRISEYAEKYQSAQYLAGKRLWGVKCDAALPCATQNEISLDDAKTLVKNGVKVVAEGANMPTEPRATELFQKSRVLFGPAKAANAGGVAVSGLEQS
jgi:glutamate dehydrogenase (NADP+)